MKHTSAAAWRLRQGNPVPDDAFGGAARDSLGRATFERIITSTATPPSEPDRGRRTRARSAASRPGRSGRRLALRYAVPATAVVAAAATASAVALSGAGTQSHQRQHTYTLDAFLTVRPQAHPGDAAAVLRRLAARAATQPTLALGPVEYSSNQEWGYIGDNIPRNLNYFSRHSYSNQAWDALSGASAVRIVRNFDGKVFTSYYPATKWSAQQGAWINPATLPASPSALRQRLLFGSGANQAGWSGTYTLHASGHPHDKGQQVELGEVPTRSDFLKNLRLEKEGCHCAITNVRIHKIGPFGDLSWQVVFVSTAIQFMSGEPLPPAVHSAMLQVLAQIVAHPGNGYTYVDMGTATDHLGRTGVVIGQEQANSAGPNYVGVQSLIFDPRTGALLDVANAQCEIPMGAIPTATGQCTPTDYTEFNAPRAVPTLPHYRAHIPGLTLQAGGPYV